MMPSLRMPSLCVLMVLINAVAVAGQKRNGRCGDTGYMNIGWSGMSKAKCLERAYEVNGGAGPSGQCGHVSYSASSGPQGQSNFCRCHGSCDGALEQPAGEQWETYVTGARQNMSKIWILVVCLTGGVLVVLLCLAIALCYRSRKRAAGNAKNVEANPEKVEEGNAVAVVATLAPECGNHKHNNIVA